MFRRLFAIETEALRMNADDRFDGQRSADAPLGERIRDAANFVSTPSRYGFWASHAA